MTKKKGSTKQSKVAPGVNKDFKKLFEKLQNSNNQSRANHGYNKSKSQSFSVVSRRSSTRKP